MVILEWSGYEYEVEATIFSEVVVSMSLSDIITNYGKLRGPSARNATGTSVPSGLNTIKGQLKKLVDNIPGGAAGHTLNIGNAASMALALKKGAKKVSSIP